MQTDQSKNSGKNDMPDIKKIEKDLEKASKKIIEFPDPATNKNEQENIPAPLEMPDVDLNEVDENELKPVKKKDNPGEK